MATLSEPLVILVPALRPKTLFLLPVPIATPEFLPTKVFEPPVVIPIPD